jgi:hypothetical protein
MNLPDGLLALLHQPSLCYLATTMADGSPQLTQTWVDTDGEHVLINSVRGFQKIRNIERDPRVQDAIEARMKQIRAQIDDTTSDFDREKLQEPWPSWPAAWR